MSSIPTNTVVRDRKYNASVYHYSIFGCDTISLHFCKPCFARLQMQVMVLKNITSNSKLKQTLFESFTVADVGVRLKVFGLL